MIAQAAKTWNVLQFVKMVEHGTITFSNIYQRSYVWDKDRECKLFASLVESFPIPAINASRHTAEKKGDPGVYDLLNGKQRVTALTKIFGGEVRCQNLWRLRLNPEDPIDLTDEEKEFLKYGEEYDEGQLIHTIDVNGLTYNELPLSIRTVMASRMMRIEYNDNLTREEERRIIINANSGKGMSAIERTRIEMRSFETLLKLSKHPIFNCLSESAIKGYVNEDICLKMWIVLYTEDPSLETKEVRPLARTAIITEDQMKEIWSILCRLEEIAKRVDKPNVKKRILARLHMSTLAPIVKRSIDDQISIEEMTYWLSHFFSGTKRASINEKYNEAARISTAQRGSVRTRLHELEEAYENRFGKRS